eukprot:scaffold12093_cov137-Isochrysis_galbana.AAC.9
MAAASLPPSASCAGILRRPRLSVAPRLGGPGVYESAMLLVGSTSSRRRRILWSFRDLSFRYSTAYVAMRTA